MLFRSINLNDVINNKPTIINFVYLNCPLLCHLLLDGLTEVIKESNYKIAEDYQVLTISIDPKESNENLNSYKRKYLNQLNINNSYNIGVKLLVKNNLWILESIEISDSDFETIEEDIVDYHEIREDLLLKLNIRSNSINKNLGELNSNLNKLNELKNELENNFRNTEIENYYKLIN